MAAYIPTYVNSIYVCNLLLYTVQILAGMKQLKDDPLSQTVDMAIALQLL